MFRKNCCQNYMIEGNSFEGNIPSEIGRMNSLQLLSLSDNNLKGNIPSELVLQSLVYLYLSGDKLSGTILTFIGQLASLRELDLSSKSFSGSIPKQLGRCTNLEQLALSSNKLSNEIPPEVASLKNIHIVFNLSRNFLSGPVQGMLLQMAEIIKLFHNNLLGEITHYMAGWLDARNIDLSFNNFSGVLPDSLGVRLAALKSIDLSSNNFTGSIPKSLYNLSTLTFLNISNNNFEGNVSCSGSFRKLSSSSFHHNPLLCGKCFNLKCRNKAKQKHSSTISKKMKIIIITIAAAIVGVLSATIVLYLRLTKKSSRNARASFKAGNQFMVVTEEEVVRATGNFSPNNILGQGNQGFVYAGVLGEGDPVAIKVFSHETQQIAEKGSFLKECQTLGMIRHRNLIKIITVCCTENIKAIIMPLMPKGSLHSLLHEKDSYGCLAAISLQSRFRILKEIASGLSYLHHHCTPPIVHCDIKPENVLLDYDFTAKLSDFGIAKVLGNSNITVSSILKGSIGYIAPGMPTLLFLAFNF